MSNVKARSEEQRFMEDIYTQLELDHQKALDEWQFEKERSKTGAFEDQDAFIPAQGRNRANEKLKQIRKRNESIFAKPYFAHIEVQEAQEKASEHYFLSNNENLDESIEVRTRAGECCIVPFIRKQERKMLGALMDCYQRRNGDPFSVPDARGSGEYLFEPQLIRDVEVRERQLNNVVTFYSRKGEDDIVASGDEVDELLAQRLQENRAEPCLHNIIATLQRQQFEIVNADPNVDMAVQGCAGSGKTQCLIHRLFYLRGELRDAGWEKVLLITPTQAFREYSAELMRRYQVDSVANTSIADLYRALLEAFDARFRSRQYVFKLSEEYLPDRYLHDAYAPENLVKLEKAISDAIWNRIVDACQLLEQPEPTRENVDIQLVNGLVAQLTERMRRFDETEREMANDPEYLEHRGAIDKLDGKLNVLYRRQEKLEEQGKRLDDLLKEYTDLHKIYQDTEKELEERESSIHAGKEDARNRLQECARRLEQATSNADVLRFLTQYVLQRNAVFDAQEPWGDAWQRNQEEIRSLQKLCLAWKDELSALIGETTPEAWLREHEKKARENADKLAALQEDIARAEQSLDDHSRWLEAHDIEEAKKQRQTYRQQLERARYYLSRIESSVFEQEVWNELVPLKKKYGIKTIQEFKAQDGRVRQNRILYKVDLLFYLKIYETLHRSRSLPEYRLICIDEGQDLHRADYELLRRLYPGAVFNIFGDTAQVLHEDCGVQDWRKDTGIQQVFQMNINYRNDPAIVEFCNHISGGKMGYFGSASGPQPQQADMADFKRAVREQDQTIIVKNRDAFDEMCGRMQLDPGSLRYIDTRTEKVEPGKTKCYSVFAAKGLEFSSVLVYAEGMTIAQKVVACSRAMEKLTYYGI